MNNRKYLPTLSELIDRLSIAQLKEVFISEHKQEYSDEIKDIVKDNAPCVVTQKRSVNEVIINNKELTSMNGDVDSFFNHLHKIIKH